MKTGVNGSQNGSLKNVKSIATLEAPTATPARPIVRSMAKGLIALEEALKCLRRAQETRPVDCSPSIAESYHKACAKVEWALDAAYREINCYVVFSGCDPRPKADPANKFNEETEYGDDDDFDGDHANEDQKGPAPDQHITQEAK